MIKCFCSAIACMETYCGLQLWFEQDSCRVTVFRVLLRWRLGLSFVPLCVCFAYGCLNGLDHFVTGLEGIVFCKDMANILHACLHTLGHEAKHPGRTQKQIRSKAGKRQLNKTWTPNSWRNELLYDCFNLHSDSLKVNKVIFVVNIFLFKYMFG